MIIPQRYFSIFPMYTPQSFTTDLVATIEKFLNHETDFKSCGNAG